MVLGVAGTADAHQGGLGSGCDAKSRAYNQQSEALVGRGSGMTEGGWEAAAFSAATSLSSQSLRQKLNRETAKLPLYPGERRKREGRGTQRTADFPEVGGRRGAWEGPRHWGLTQTRSAGIPREDFRGHPPACPTEPGWRRGWPLPEANGAPSTGEARPAGCTGSLLQSGQGRVRGSNHHGHPLGPGCRSLLSLSPTHPPRVPQVLNISPGWKLEGRGRPASAHSPPPV